MIVYEFKLATPPAIDAAVVAALNDAQDSDYELVTASSLPHGRVQLLLRRPRFIRTVRHGPLANRQNTLTA